MGKRIKSIKKRQSGKWVMNNLKRNKEKAIETEFIDSKIGKEKG